jgi:peptide/nickel transport system substrate-binding protein
VPVPKEYASKFDSKTPSTYDQYVTFTGPYLVQNDPKTGKVTGRVPGKSITIVRNPNWDKATDYRPAYLDQVFVQEGNDDLATAARRALAGSASVCCDTSESPAQVLKQAVTQYKGQALFAPSGGVLYIAFNTTVKPFDNINIRKAIVAGANRTALRLAQGGAVAGGVASGWIPPGVPGYAEAGGPKQNSDVDFLANPNGDPALAKKYMLAAKEQDPSLAIEPTASGPAAGRS